MLEEVLVLVERAEQHVVDTGGSDGSTTNGIDLLLAFVSMFAFFEHSDRAQVTFTVLDMFAEELAAELERYYLCAQTRSLGLVAEVNTVNGIEVIFQCDKAPDATPQTLTFERQNGVVLAVDSSVINRFAIPFFLLDIFIVERSGISFRIVHVQRREDLFLHVETLVGILTLFQTLAHNS